MQVGIISWSLFRHRQHTLIEYLMNSASFWRYVFSAAHVYFVDTIGVTHFNTLVRFVSVSLTPLLSHQSINYLTCKTVTISRQEEKIFFHVLWKKRIYPFRENVLHTCVIRCSVLFLVIFTKKENDINHFFYFVSWSLKNVFSHILAEGERDLECLSVWKCEINN